jgi:hypothetical protein
MPLFLRFRPVALRLPPFGGVAFVHQLAPLNYKHIWYLVSSFIYNSTFKFPIPACNNRKIPKETD